MLPLVLVLAAGVPEAVAYLEAEVPRWQPDNGCYSCHNNGDAARALFLAGRRASPALADTLTFLRNPAAWPEKDAALAAVQFALALAASGEKSPALAQAAARVARTQSPDGHWTMDAEANPGSPVTYGPVLGTVLARQVLQAASPAFDAHTAKADAWLQARRAQHPVDLAALVLAFARPADIQRLADLQAPDGSWGAAEPFDTALAILALKGHHEAAVKRGRAWLLAHQLEPGGWPGTTRPAGGASYAQHVSTTAWALLALLD